MTKQDILEFFNDINDAYNNPNKHDDLSKMLDMLAQSENPNKWIPITTRPMTEDEKSCCDEGDEDEILDCPLPEYGQEVLVSWGGHVRADVFWRDGYGCYFEGVDFVDVQAWMPLPEPYKAESKDKK